MLKKWMILWISCLLLAVCGTGTTVFAASQTEPAAADTEQMDVMQLPPLHEIPNQAYTGEPVQPVVSFSDGVVLRKGEDYTVSYQNNVMPGTATVTVTGVGSYEGSSRTAEFQIVADFSAVTVAAIPDQTYTGLEICPQPVCTLDGETLKRDVDYTVSYVDNVNAGTAAAVVTGIGNYRGEQTVSFVIRPAALPKLPKIANQSYTGKAVRPKLTLKNGKVSLKENVDYEVSYRANTKVGTASLTVTGTGNYTGSRTASFSIVPAKVTGLSASVTTDSVQLTWKKAAGAQGYHVYRWNSKTKKWNLLKTTTGRSYTDKKRAAGTEYRYAVKAYKTVGGKSYNASYPTLTVATKPAKTVLSNVVCKKGKNVIVSWRKQTCTGYQVYRATSKNGKYTRIATIKNSKTVSYTDRNRTVGKAYYYKVRAYKSAGGKNYYGAFSKIGKKVVPRILISIGHGTSMYGNSYDPGAMYGKYQEFKLAREIGKYAAQYYKANFGGTCELSNYDGSIGLAKKVNQLKNDKYTLVCEVHLNAGGGNGTSVFYTRRVAKSKEYAQKVAAQLAKDLKVRNRGALTMLNWNGSDSLMFLRETKPAAILIETVFIDNSGDLAKVKTASGQKKAGVAIAKALGAVAAKMD